MKTPLRLPSRQAGRFRVGDRVRSRHGFPGALGEIVEDRGPIGHKGRYFYHVVFRDDTDQEMRLDWPEDELILAESDKSSV